MHHLVFNDNETEPVGKFRCSFSKWNEIIGRWFGLTGTGDPPPACDRFAVLTHKYRIMQVVTFVRKLRQKFDLPEGTHDGVVMCRWVEVNYGLKNELSKDSEMYGLNNYIVMNDAGDSPVGLIQVTADKWKLLVEEWTKLTVITEPSPDAPTLARAQYNLRKAEVAVIFAQLRYNYALSDNCDANVVFVNWVDKKHNIPSKKFTLQY